jgi:hypothetical protein
MASQVTASKKKDFCNQERIKIVTLCENDMRLASTFCGMVQINQVIWLWQEGHTKKSAISVLFWW